MVKLTKKGHGLGAFPSPKNPEFLGFPRHVVTFAGAFAPRMSITGKIGPTRDQGQTGMCTGEGSTGMGMRLYSRWKNQVAIFAPEFTYALERLKEGTFDQGDVGANVSTSMEVADPNMKDPNCIGWCPTGIAGYQPLNIASKPSIAQLAAARAYPGGAFHSLGNDIGNIKACIASDYTFVIGIAVYDSFESDTAAASGLIPYPNPGAEQLQGYHEMHFGMIFDDTIQCPGAPNKGAVLGQNSWGTQWGIKCPDAGISAEGGFCWLPYDYFLNPNLTTDVRMQHLGKAW